MDLYKILQDESKCFLISGPCVIEDEEIMMKTAEKLTIETQKRNIHFIFKSSFQKANRTSINSFTGPGLDDGLRILDKIRNRFGIHILTDVHETNQVDQVADVADVIQIPAFLCRQTDLITKAASTKKIVNIKKGQFMAPEDMKSAAEKITSRNNFNIMITERGSCFGYHNLIVDFRSFPILKSIGYPVVYDVTHSLQRPSIQKITGGNPEYGEMMAKSALATGYVDGLFIETHPRPLEALSDGMSMIPLPQMSDLLDSCMSIVEAIERVTIEETEFSRFE